MEELLYKLVVLCKCKIGTLPFDYLGIPLGADPRIISTWNTIVEKFKKKLFGWKSRSLSFARRVALITIVLLSLLIYFMSIFKALETVIKRIDNIRRNFLWREKMERKG